MYHVGRTTENTIFAHENIANSELADISYMVMHRFENSDGFGTHF